MKHEEEFKAFLTTVKRSGKTGEVYSAKVANDILRRCKTAEQSLSIELSETTMGDSEFVEQACRTIRVMKMTSTPGNPNNHNSLIHSLKVYCEFLASRG